MNPNPDPNAGAAPDPNAPLPSFQVVVVHAPPAPPKRRRRTTAPAAGNPAPTGTPTPTGTGTPTPTGAPTGAAQAAQTGAAPATPQQTPAQQAAAQAGPPQPPQQQTSPRFYEVWWANIKKFWAWMIPIGIIAGSLMTAYFLFAPSGEPEDVTAADDTTPTATERIKSLFSGDGATTLVVSNGVVLSSRPRGSTVPPGISIAGVSNATIQIAITGDASPVSFGTGLQQQGSSAQPALLSIGEKIRGRPMDVNPGIELGEYVPVQVGDEEFELIPHEKAVIEKDTSKKSEVKPVLRWGHKASYESSELPTGETVIENTSKTEVQKFRVTWK